MTVHNKSRTADHPRFKMDRRSKVTRIEVDFYHAGGCTELQRARFQKFALEEAAQVKKTGFDAVRYGSFHTWIITVTHDRTQEALRFLHELASTKGTS